MEFGLAHALFITRMKGFMLVVSEESLWQELKENRFTTPLLREWMPYVEGQLRTQDLLEEALVFNVTCGVLSATTTHLDKIVTDGLKSGEIRIPGRKPSLSFRSEPDPEPAPLPVVMRNEE